MVFEPTRPSTSYPASSTRRFVVSVVDSVLPALAPLPIEGTIVPSCASITWEDEVWDELRPSLP